MFGNLGQGLGQQIAAGTTRHIVHNHRHGRSVRNSSKVGNQAVLGGLVVVRGHHQHGIRPHFAGVAGIVQHMLGIVGTGAGNHRNPARHLLYRIADDFLLILRLNGGIFAGGAHHHNGIDAAFDLEFQESSQSIIVNAGFGHGGDNGSGHSGKDGVLHKLSLLC